MRVLFLVGLPASGKSTFRSTILERAAENRARDEYVVVSSDDEIEKIAYEREISYNDVFKNEKLVKLAMLRANTAFNQALADKKYIILDRTNMSRKSRASYIELALDNKYECDAVVFARPETQAQHDEWNRRLERPGKTIPNGVLQDMYCSYQEPQLFEGFANIVDVNTFES